MQPISGIEGMAVQRALEHATQSSPAVDEMSRHFADLLGRDEPPMPMPEVGAQSALSQMLSEHEQAFAGLTQDLVRAPAETQHMSPQQATMKQVEMMFRVVTVTMQHTAMSSLAQSTKTGLQTLIKNQ